MVLGSTLGLGPYELWVSFLQFPEASHLDVLSSGQLQDPEEDWVGFFQALRNKERQEK